MCAIAQMTSTCVFVDCDARHAAELLNLINEAYEVESGSTGVAFKCTPRFDSVREVEDLIHRSTVVAARDAAGALLGAISYELEGDSCYFGPFAVRARGRLAIAKVVDFIGKVAVFGTQKLAGIRLVPAHALDVAVEVFL